MFLFSSILVGNIPIGNRIEKKKAETYIDSLKQKKKCHNNKIESLSPVPTQLLFQYATIYLLDLGEHGA